MDGFFRQTFPFRKPKFQGRTLSFREGMFYSEKISSRNPEEKIPEGSLPNHPRGGSPVGNKAWMAWFSLDFFRVLPVALDVFNGKFSGPN